MNHKMGADRAEKFKAIEVDTNDRTKAISDPYDIEVSRPREGNLPPLKPLTIFSKGWTAFDFPGRGEKYSPFKWNFNHFTGVDYNSETGKKGIFRIEGDNKGWALGVDSEHVN